MEARDHAAVVATFAPGIVLNSPIITPRFEGRAAVSDLYAAILESFDEYEYTSEMEGAGWQLLGFRARFGKRWVDGVDMLRVDEDGQIAEMTVMFRRLVGGGDRRGRPRAGARAQEGTHIRPPSCAFSGCRYRPIVNSLRDSVPALHSPEIAFQAERRRAAPARKRATR